jgi:hypothetical protein
MTFVFKAKQRKEIDFFICKCRKVIIIIVKYFPVDFSHQDIFIQNKPLLAYSYILSTVFITIH